MLLGNNPFPQDPRVSQEARSLVEAGYDVTVVCPRAEGQSRREQWRGVDIHRYRKPIVPPGSLGIALEWGQVTLASLAHAVRIAANGGFDVIHAHNPPDTFWLIGALFKPLGKRFVYDHHDLAPEMYEARLDRAPNRAVQGVLARLDRLSHRVADHVIATNESYRRIAIERGGVPPDRVTIVRNGPDLDRVHPVEPDPELRRRAGTLLGYAGYIGRQDGVDHLLRAVHHLVRDLGRTDVLAVVLGTGDALEELRRLAAELGIEEHVSFEGWKTGVDLLRALSTVDICVDPDPSNSFNDRSTMIKMFEYMTLGRPIVAFDLPEHRVTAGDAAVYATPNDDLELARAIAGLMDDPVKRERMGELGRRRVETALQWSFSVPPLLEAYSQVLEGER